MPRPKKITGEIGFEEMLRWAMPKNRIEDRFKFYRFYLRDNLHRHGSNAGWKATEEEIDQAIADARKKKYNVDSDSTAIHFAIQQYRHLSNYGNYVSALIKTPHAYLLD